MESSQEQRLSPLQTDSGLGCGWVGCACGLPVSERFVLWALRQWQQDRALPAQGSILHRGFKMAGLLEVLPDFAIAMDAFLFGARRAIGRRRGEAQLSAGTEASDRIAQLQRAMRLIADAIEDLPAECRDLAGNALLNIAAEAVAQDVGCAEAGRIFSRLADLLARGLQPPIGDAISLTAFDA